jgi:TRAP-type C4-dicarboxylate transport system substrate-binding protein
MEGQKVQRAANRTLNEKSLASLKTKGMQVNEVNSAEQNRIRAKVASVYDKHKDSIGADAIKVVQDELRKARGG